MAVTPQDLLLEDYKQKISYLTNHFTRMWTGFNCFGASDTALGGGLRALVVDKGNEPKGNALCPNNSKIQATFTLCSQLQLEKELLPVDSAIS